MRTRSRSLSAGPKSSGLLAQLQGGDRRSIGNAERVAAFVPRNPRLFAVLVRGLWHSDRLVRMRAADAAEKISRERPEWLQPFKQELLGLMAETQEQELRWHVAVMVPRLSLTNSDRQRAVAQLESYLSDRSSIVKTFTMQGLADLAHHDPKLHAKVAELLRNLSRNGTPAMKARGRKLLAQLEQKAKS